MIKHSDINDSQLRKMIRANEINFGGNVKLKIYGKLNCKSGKRMKRENRVFFQTSEEAIAKGYRPCGHCMRKDYMLNKQ
ncbi:Ada metal-binding domain-containing protein [Chitinophagaceae bacterium 26-R-25]|nr:Ada metal-binding domain-containing protein [Chitinophagaceae bacterium 26-R-25]